MTRAATSTQVLLVFVKEWIDALRDRRTLLRLAVPALLLGPLMLALMSSLIAQATDPSNQRQIQVVGIEHAPTLRNFLLRQNLDLQAPPEDYERALRERRLGQPVLVVPAEFEAALARGDPAPLELVSDSANTRARASMDRLVTLVERFGRERASLQLMLNGVPGSVLQPVALTERDLASAEARSAQLSGMIPMFVIMAVLYGCLTAALDSTAGERERGSLEPLLMNPVQPLALVVGKWLAVALMGAAVAVLCSASFVPAQLLIRSDALQAMFRFGWGEVLQFALVLLPLCAALGALLMAVAIRTRTFKEAQASATLVMTVVSFAPVVTMLNMGSDRLWHFAVPGLGQSLLMTLVLKGEPAGWLPWLLMLVSATVLAALCLGYVARHMRQAVAR